MELYIPWIISGIALIVTVLTYIRNGRRSMQDDIRKDDSAMGSLKESLLKVNLKLDQVCATTNETRTDIKSMGADLKALETRVVVLERDSKTAFKILDELRKE